MGPRRPPASSVDRSAPKSADVLGRMLKWPCRLKRGDSKLTKRRRSADAHTEYLRIMDGRCEWAV